MRITILGLACVTALSALPAEANTPRIKGQYAFTGFTSCLVSPGSDPSAPSNPTPGVMLPNAGFDANLRRLPNSRAFTVSFSVLGTRTFNGDGTGSVQGTAHSINGPPTPGPTGYPSFPPSASANSFTGNFNYIIQDDSTLLITDGFMNSAFTQGPRTGQTSSHDSPQKLGIISADGKTIMLSDKEVTVEIVTYSNGDVWPRICSRSRVLHKMGGADKD